MTDLHTPAATTDIIDRLRGTMPHRVTNDLLNEAAEEIEALRDLLNSVADALAEYFDDDAYAEEGLIQLIEEALSTSGSDPADGEL